MNTSKFGLKALILASIIASSVVAGLSVYRTAPFMLRGWVHIERGTAPTIVAGPTAPRCRRALRVVRVAADDVLNLRDQPDAQAPIRLGIGAGSRGLVDLEQRVGAWRYVSFRGEKGFVHGAFVEDEALVCMQAPDAAHPMRGHDQDASRDREPTT